MMVHRTRPTNSQAGVEWEVRSSSVQRVAIIVAVHARVEAQRHDGVVVESNIDIGIGNVTVSVERNNSPEIIGFQEI